MKHVYKKSQAGNSSLTLFGLVVSKRRAKFAALTAARPTSISFQYSSRYLAGPTDCRFPKLADI